MDTQNMYCSVTYKNKLSGQISFESLSQNIIWCELCAIMLCKATTLHYLVPDSMHTNITFTYNNWRTYHANSLVPSCLYCRIIMHSASSLTSLLWNLWFHVLITLLYCIYSSSQPRILHNLISGLNGWRCKILSHCSCAMICVLRVAWISLQIYILQCTNNCI